MERPINNLLHVPSSLDDGGDVFLSLTFGSSSSEATAAAGTPPPVLHGRRRRRRGQRQQASSSFDCRTCGREFPTFQALGGHRTSHFRRPTTTTKKKLRSEVHACAMCGLGFSTGQALGGHMRRHRGGPNGDVCALDLERAVGLHERPKSTASLQLLDLFV